MTRGVRASKVRVAGETLVVMSYPSEESAESIPRVTLSPAERQVRDAVLLGHSNAAIARARGTSTRTVANQLASLYRKLGVSSRFELAALTAEMRIRGR